MPDHDRVSLFDLSPSSVQRKFNTNKSYSFLKSVSMYSCLHAVCVNLGTKWNCTNYETIMYLSFSFSNNKYWSFIASTICRLPLGRQNFKFSQSVEIERVDTYLLMRYSHHNFSDYILLLKLNTSFILKVRLKHFRRLFFPLISHTYVLEILFQCKLYDP